MSGATGFTGFAVSTAHVVTAHLPAAPAGAESGIRPSPVRQIIAVRILTLPATVLPLGGLIYVLG